MVSQRNELDYQPLPTSKADSASRSQGTYSRLEAINAVLSSEPVSPRVGMDIGSHIGFFSINLAKQGMLVHAVESNKERLLLSFLLARQEKVPLAPMPLRVDKSSVDILPEADVTLCLSVWHHWVRHYGLEDATHILQTVIDKTRRLVFFDSGEEEMPAIYKLPYVNESSAAFFTRYLEQFAGVGESLDLGRHQAISPADKSGVRRNVFRTLYCLRKNPSAFA